MADLFTGIFTNFGVVLGFVIALILALLVFAFYALLAVLGLILVYAIIKASMIWLCRLFVWAFPDGSSAQRWFNDLLKKLE